MCCLLTGLLRRRVGHLLAEQKIQTAKMVAKAGMGAGACTLCVAVALVSTDAARDFWTALFTPAEMQAGAEMETVAGMLADIHTIWPLVMLFLIVDGFYALNGGLMRALGLQGSSLGARLAMRCPAGSRAANVRLVLLATARNALATFVSLWICGVPIIYWGVLGKWHPESVPLCS